MWLTYVTFVSQTNETVINSISHKQTTMNTLLLIPTVRTPASVVVRTRNPSSHIDVHTHAGNTLYIPATLTFVFLIYGSVQAQVLLQSVGLCVYQVWC